MAKTYFEKLRDPRWQRKRLEIMQRANFSCEWCREEKNTLHVHHGYYTKGYEPWDYGEDTLYCLCEGCHEKAEKLKHNIHLEIARIHPKHHTAFMSTLLQWKSEHRERVRSSIATTTSKEISLDVPVVVVGVINGCITDEGLGHQEFRNFVEAKHCFPELDAESNTKKFTCPMKEMSNGAVVRLRFETWKAYELYSS